MTASLRGKVVLITGAGSGIGRATAEHVLTEGGIPVISDLAPPDWAPPEVLSLAWNVADPLAADAAVARTLESHCRIDGLVTCAGIVAAGGAGQFTLEEWNRALTVHLTGQMLAAQAAAPALAAGGGGAVVLVSSIYGMTGGTGNLPYNVAKGGVLQLMRSLAADLAEQGTRVNAVSPGYISTPMTGAVAAATAVHDAFVAMHLLRRPGRPEEVAAAIAFLLSDAASFITGANIPVDGGFSAAQVISPQGAAHI